MTLRSLLLLAVLRTSAPRLFWGRMKNMIHTILNSALRMLMIKKESVEVLVDLKTGLFFECTYSKQDEDGDINHSPIYSKCIDKAMFFSVETGINSETPAQVVNNYFSGTFEVRNISLYKRCSVVGFENNGFGDFVQTDPTLTKLSAPRL